MSIQTVLVPLHPPHGCQLCLPIPRDYADHAGLVKHLKLIHSTTLQFECRACGYTHEKLKTVKAHQLRVDDCRAKIEALSPPPALPADRKKICIPTRPRKPYVRRKPKATPANPPSGDSSWSSAPPSPPTRQTAPRNRRATRSIQTITEESQPSQRSPTASTSSTPRLYSQVAAASAMVPATSTASQRSTATSTKRRRNTRSSTRKDPDPSPPRSVSQPVPASPTQLTGDTPCPPPGKANHSYFTPVQTVTTTRDNIASPPTDPPSPPHQAPSTQPSPPATALPPSDLQSSADASGGPPQWVTAWADRFNATLDEDMLEGVLHDFMRLTYEICDIQGPRRNQ
ncbi:mucin-2-like [Centruroides sculpturatus]|uniref:mucin-2-like n=1 Tax=Centruroides sculpturatus TaxID=218467 RepID=UPI000C6E3EC9|nr:mucin-2-like [Centruroides sculpturatus]